MKTIIQSYSKNCCTHFSCILKFKSVPWSYNPAAKQSTMRRRTLNYMSDPIIKQKHKEACNTPERNASQRASKLGKKCIYNPTTLETIRVEDPNPYLADGWILGFIRKSKRTVRPTERLE